MMKYINYLLVFILTISNAWSIPREADRQILEINGRNLLKNGGFENRKIQFKESGGVFVIETSAANVLTGKRSASWDPSAASQNLDTDLIAIPNGLKGGTCSASFKYKWEAGVVEEIKFQVLDQASNVLVTVDLSPTVPNIARTIPVTFPCPTGTDTARIRWTSTADTAKIFLDEVFLGKQIFTTIAEAEIYGNAVMSGITNCIYTITQTTYASDFSADSDCNTYVVSGGLTNPGTKVPHINMDNAPPGDYLVNVQFTNVIANGASIGSCRLVDELGTQMAEIYDSGDTTPFKNPVMMQGRITLNTTTNKEFKIQCRTASGIAHQISNDSGGTGASSEIQWIVTRFPIASQKSLRVDQVGFYLDVNIGGANPALSSASVTSYTEIIDAGLDLVINPGSRGAQIPCSTTNASTGLTCSSGSESLGVVFDLPRSGIIRVCSAVGWNFTPTSAGSTENTWQWVETPNDAQTISQFGKDRATIKDEDGSTGAEGHAIRVCGTFKMDSAGQKTLRLMYVQNLIGGAYSANEFLMDRASGSGGGRDMHITVEMKSQNSGAITFPDMVITKGGNRLFNFVSAKILMPGTPSLVTAREYGDWVDLPLLDNSVGNVSIPIKVGAFSGIPNCDCTLEGVLNEKTCLIDGTTPVSATVVRVKTFITSTGVATDEDFVIKCHGPIN